MRIGLQNLNLDELSIFLCKKLPTKIHNNFVLHLRILPEDHGTL